MTLSPANNARGGYPLGLAGASSATRYVGATASGAPASGTFEVGDFVIDQSGAVQVCTVAGTPGTWVEVGGGGGSQWTADLDAAGTSLTGWTQETGTWSVASSAFTVSTPASTAQRLYNSTIRRHAAALIVECEVKINSGSGHAGSGWAGLTWGWDGSGSGGCLVAIHTGNVLYPEQDVNVASTGSIAFTVALDTYYKIRAVVNGNLCDVYADGVHKGAFGGMNSAQATAAYLGLLARNCSASFRNIKSWYSSLGGLPA